LQGHFQLGVLTAELANGVGQHVGQDGPQPGDELAFALPAKLVTLLVGLEQRLLDQVRRIELPLKTRVQLRPGQEAQVLAVLLQRPILHLLSHRRYP
jgi:hypothetical protein